MLNGSNNMPETNYDEYKRFGLNDSDYSDGNYKK